MFTLHFLGLTRPKSSPWISWSFIKRIFEHLS